METVSGEVWTVGVMGWGERVEPMPTEERVREIVRDEIAAEMRHAQEVMTAFTTNLHHSTAFLDYLT